MTAAATLMPGDVFTLPSGATHQAAEVNALSHRISVRTTVGVWVTLFPTVDVLVGRSTGTSPPI